MLLQPPPINHIPFERILEEASDEFGGGLRRHWNSQEEVREASRGRGRKGRGVRRYSNISNVCAV